MDNFELAERKYWNNYWNSKSLPILKYLENIMLDISADTRWGFIKSLLPNPDRPEKLPQRHNDTKGHC